MNQKLKKQIKAYAGFAGALLVADKANGQVVFVDVNPDTLINADPVNSGPHHFLLDVNNDAANDFDFMVKYQTPNSSTSWYARFTNITPLNNNEIGNKLYATYPGSYLEPYPAKLNPGDTIGANGSWVNDPNQCIRGWWEWGSSPQQDIMDYSGGCGVWGTGTDKCLGFRLVQGSNYYYGWLRIEMLSNSSFLLKEYAYQWQSNVPMLACDTTNLATGISQYNHLQFNFSQQNNSIHISTFQKLNHANVFVYDLLGKEIFQKLFEGKETTITINKKGIYFVDVKSDRGIFRKKIFIY